MLHFACVYIVKDIRVVCIYICMNIMCVYIVFPKCVHMCIYIHIYYIYIHIHTYIYLDYYLYMNIFKTNGVKVLLNHVRKKLMKWCVLVVPKNWCSLSPFENEL